MIKLLEDLLIEATTSPNVPGSLVAGLRKAVDAARCGSVKGKTFAFSDVLPTLSPASTDMLPPPFDSLEEAQRAAGVVPPQVAVDSPYRVCIKAHETNVGNTVPVGHVVTLEAGELLQQPERWAPCDKDGWVSCNVLAVQPGIARHLDHVRNAWRPLPPKPSAIDEMAEQIKRWAAPTREEVAKSHAEMWEHLTAAVPVESAVDTKPTKPTNPKDAAATDRVPLGLLSPIAKAHWALAQHCGRAKYGAWNWREAGVRASIYIDAIGRHTDGYLSGETYDPADNTHHLGNIMACCAILLEAEAAGKLTDDRPPTLDMRPTYAEVQRRLADLTTKYADRNPKHWTR